ncbi:MAG: hypothetical protein H0V82_03415 [Candidatus Protochlamydia sp.]|nr:hypothetical protein [Candidatus Protochlamydia sp.]
MTAKIYHIRILDFKYLSDFAHITFQFLTYEVLAHDEEKAIQEARALYFKGEKGILCKKLPLLLKLFEVAERQVR